MQSRVLLQIKAIKAKSQLQQKYFNLLWDRHIVEDTITFINNFRIADFFNGFFLLNLLTKFWKMLPEARCLLC